MRRGFMAGDFQRTTGKRQLPTAIRSFAKRARRVAVGSYAW